MSSSRAQKLVALARDKQHLSHNDNISDSEKEQVIETNYNHVTMLARVNQDPVLKYLNTASSSITTEQMTPNLTLNINDIEIFSSLIQPEDLDIVENSLQSTFLDHECAEIESRSMNIDDHTPVIVVDSVDINSIEFQPIFPSENIGNQLTSLTFIMESQTEGVQEKNLEAEPQTEEDVQEEIIENNLEAEPQSEEDVQEERVEDNSEAEPQIEEDIQGERVKNNLEAEPQIEEDIQGERVDNNLEAEPQIEEDIQGERVENNLEAEPQIEEDIQGERVENNLEAEPQIEEDVQEERITNNLEAEPQIEDEIGRPKRGRKRKIIDQPRTERKRRANFNEKYVSAKGKAVKPKQFDEFFNCGCKKKCTDILSIGNRKRIFDQFWSLGTYEGRCAFICGKVKQTNKARSYTTTDSRRKYTRQYFIYDTEICKKTFLKTLGICQSRIDVALQKKYEANDFKDNRGAASGGNNKTSEENTKRIIDHINSFPKYVSHYCRDKTDSRYLNTDLNLSKMYDLFKSKYPNLNNLPSLATYKKIFYENFNLRFKPPKSDTCKTCDKFAASIKSLTGTCAEEAKQKRDEHVNKAYALRNKMNADLKLASEDESVETLTFDMQKTHPLPKIPTNVAYYKRQLNLYNLGIFIGSNKNSVFNLWLEHEAGKGTQEVGSCLRKYILNNIQPPVTKLFLWADSCGGQNRSIKLVLMLIHTMQHHPSLKNITLRFLLSGHSFLPNDANFGVIETQLKTQQRLYTINDYAESIKSSKKNKKYEVCRMDKSDMLSVKPLEKAITNRKVDSAKDKVNWLNVHEIVIEKDSPYALKIKNDIEQENSQVVNIEKAGKGRKASLKNINLPECWPEGKPLSKEKIKDLKDLMKLVPADAKPFYDFLKRTQGVSMDEDVDGYHAEDIENLSEEED